MGAGGLRLPRMTRKRQNYTGRKALNDFVDAQLRLPRAIDHRRFF